MNNYKWCGGKKMFVFYLLLIINIILCWFNKYSDDFGKFCLMLGGMYVLGNVGEHFAGRGKNVE